MKHLSYFLFGATALLMASCSNEDLVSSGLNPDGTANVTLTLSTPQIQTRAYSDGTKAQKFIYGLYDITDAAEGEIGVYLDNITPVSDSNPDAINLKKTMSFRLLADHKYRFVCFADAGENKESSVKSSPYDVKIDGEGATIGYNFSTKPTWANQETYDAFYASREFSITGNIALDIEMFRPLAQINVGTNDIDDAADLGFEPVLSGVAFPVGTNVPSKIDLITGEVLESQAFQFMPNVVADRNETFPVKGYEYLTMVYLLAPEEQTLYDIELNYSGNDNVEHKRTVGSVPVKRNHRTNIYGQILTSDAALNIQIEPDFDDPDLQPSELEMVAALGGTVVLDDDVTLEDGKNITFIKDAIVDLNGKNVTGASDLDGVFVIDNGANVTIKGPGKVAVGDNNEDYGIAVWAQNGTVTIEGGTYEAKGETALIYSTGGTIIIKGGTFKIDDPKGQPFTLNIQDNNPTAQIIVMGGTFFNYDPSNSKSENPTANFVAKGYKVVESLDANGQDKWYTVVPADAATNDAEFLELYANPNQPVVTVAPNVELDLTAATVDQLTNNVAKTIVMGEGSQIKIGAMKYFKANADLTIIGPETESVATRAGDIEIKGGILCNEATSESTSNLDGKSQTLILVYGGTLTVKNMTLINDMNFHHHGGQGINSAAIQYWNDADIVIEDSRLYSGMYVLCGMSNNGVPASGDIKLSNSYFESNSSNIQGNWSYALRIYGTKANITDCEIKGIQGAVAVSYADLTINGGKYYTYNTPGYQDGFYAVYASNNGKVTILDGEFYGPNYGPYDEAKGYVEGTSCVVCDDGDYAMTNIIIKGGKFSGKPYNRILGKVYNPAAPLNWEAIADDAQYKWTVKAN